MRAKNRDMCVRVRNCHNETCYFEYSLKTLIKNIKLVIGPPDLPTNLLILHIINL